VSDKPSHVSSPAPAVPGRLESTSGSERLHDLQQLAAAYEIAQAQRHGAARPRRAIVIDAERSCQRTLRDDLTRLGCETRVISDIAELPGELARGAPDLIAAEYRLAGKRLEDLLAVIPEPLWPRLVIVTAYASIASAVRAVKLGVGGYLIKPTRGDQVLRAAGYSIAGDAPEVTALRSGSEPHLSLDRAIWEFLTQAVEDAGTLSGAARLLGLHARSLRRMLAKYPPPR
jgi:two-component system response regulator RegA